MTLDFANVEIDNQEPIKISKEIILSHITEEMIFEHYGIPIKRGLFRSPLRADKRPTCSLYKNKNGRLIMKDFGSDFCGDAFSFVMSLYNCSYYSALQIIANDFNIIERPKLIKHKPKLEYSGIKLETTHQSNIKVEIRNFTKNDLDWWGKYGISEETLINYRIYACQTVFLNGDLFYTHSGNSHVYGYFGGIKDGIEYWRIYFPGNKKMKFISNWTSSMIQGAHMLSKKDKDVLVITKSMKDVMVLHEFGISAIAPNSENLFLTDAQYNRIRKKYTTCVLLYDNDLAGITGMKKIHKKYPEISVAFIPRKYGAKDISDFRALYGKKKTLELIENAKKHYLNEKNEEQDFNYA